MQVQSLTFHISWYPKPCPEWSQCEEPRVIPEDYFVWPQNKIKQRRKTHNSHHTVHIFLIIPYTYVNNTAHMHASHHMWTWNCMLNIICVTCIFWYKGKLHRSYPYTHLAPWTHYNIPQRQMPQELSSDMTTSDSLRYFRLRHSSQTCPSQTCPP